MFRVKYNGNIILAHRVSYNEGSTLLIISTSDSVYTVACKSASRASDIYRAMLARPWIDLDSTDFEVIIDHI